MIKPVLFASTGTTRRFGAWFNKEREISFIENAKVGTKTITRSYILPELVYKKFVDHIKEQRWTNTEYIVKTLDNGNKYELCVNGIGVLTVEYKGTDLSDVKKQSIVFLPPK